MSCLLGMDKVMTTGQNWQKPGISRGFECLAGCPGELPTDQRLDSGGSLVFVTEPLGHDLILLVKHQPL